MINTIVVDIETLNTKQSAVVLSIGAFAFDRFNLNETRAEIINSDSERKFHYKLNIADQIFKCRTVSLETQIFWKKNNVSAMFDGQGVIVEQALIELDDFIHFASGQNKELRVYVRGQDFDLPILRDIFELYDCSFSLKYWQGRDVRTYIDALTDGCDGKIAGFKSDLNYVKHHALDDAMSDAELMCVARERLKNA